MSRARPLAVSYRRARSFSRHFITTQSSSPRTRGLSLSGSVRRAAAMRASSVDPAWLAGAARLGEPDLLNSLSRMLGLGGSSSLIIFNISSSPAARTR